MDKKDFMAKFRAGFKGTSEDQEKLEMSDKAQKEYNKKKKKKDGESSFSKIYKKITGK